MIDFKPVELSDKKVIDACLADNTYRACDFCFTNIFTWQAKFETEFAVIEETLFIRYKDVYSNLCYTIPMGKMSLEKALALIQEDARKNNIPFLMKSVTERMWEDIERVMPHTFQFEHERANDEYIYFSEKLINLQGKKLQSKRNHINRFKRDYPDWYYAPLHTKEDLDKCAEMLDEWDDLNAIKADESLRYDYIATRLMLENFDCLQLCGGSIWANGKMVAFSIGERLTDDTFVVHVEKAFGEINGAYTIINQQFAEHEAASYTYINREEDMGIESLRKAKMSYYPDILLQEKSLTLIKE